MSVKMYDRSVWYAQRKAKSTPSYLNCVNHMVFPNSCPCVVFMRIGRLVQYPSILSSLLILLLIASCLVLCLALLVVSSRRSCHGFKCKL